MSSFNYMTVAQLATKLRLSPMRVRQLIAKGSIPHVKAGKTILIDGDDATAFSQLHRPAGRPRMVQTEGQA
jgi:excisionase family DNA binding protein